MAYQDHQWINEVGTQRPAYMVYDRSRFSRGGFEWYQYGRRQVHSTDLTVRRQAEQNWQHASTAVQMRFLATILQAGMYSGRIANELSNPLDKQAQIRPNEALCNRIMDLLKSCNGQFGDDGRFGIHGYNVNVRHLDGQQQTFHIIESWQNDPRTGLALAGALVFPPNDKPPIYGTLPHDAEVISVGVVFTIGGISEQLVSPETDTAA